MANGSNRNVQVLGDLNFRLLNQSVGVDPAHIWQLLSSGVNSRESLYRGRDELRMSIDYHVLPPLREGMYNTGTFVCFVGLTNEVPSGREN